MADQASEGILSPFLRRQRMRVTRPYLRERVLDVGCGSGMLATEIQPECYLGIEVDQISLDCAINRFSSHSFQKTLPKESEKFDTVISLAVIEHVKNPEEFLENLSKRLKHDADARIVITTPHPSMDWIHDLGAMFGLFSKHANEEHEGLLDRIKLELAGKKAGLRLVLYKKFLFGANQLAVFAW